MNLLGIWLLAALSGALGAAIVYDALPGINWLIWTACTTAGLVACVTRDARRDAATLRALSLPIGFALALAGAAAVTTTPILLLSIIAFTASLLALAVTIAHYPTRAARYGALEILSAPFRATALTARGLVGSLGATTARIGRQRVTPRARGAIVALPVVVILALLFATADPLFARGRDLVNAALSTWPSGRLIFGVGLTLFVLGAYTASRETASIPQAAPRASRPPATTEWRIVLAAAAATSWLFVAFQISYALGGGPAAAGSGVTFAEYAHSGFGELAIAATGAAALIIIAESRSGDRTDRAPLTIPSLALLAAVACIIVSAFRRVNLYESAYGFTTTRVYAQAYMLMTLVAVGALAIHVAHGFDIDALARHVMVIALATLTVVAYWNADAWVAQKNIDRLAQTGKIDVAYLTRGLSPDAYQVLAASLPRVGATNSAAIVAGLREDYKRRSALQSDARWFEWNARRSSARERADRARYSSPLEDELHVYGIANRHAIGPRRWPELHREERLAQLIVVAAVGRGSEPEQRRLASRVDVEPRDELEPAQFARRWKRRKKELLGRRWIVGRVAAASARADAASLAGPLARADSAA